MLDISTAVNTALVAVFELPGLALALAFAILACCMVVVIWVYARRYQPLKQELQVRNAALRFVADAPTEADAHAAFAHHFDDVAKAMTETDRRHGELRHAWTQFNETIVNPTDATLRATTRPDGYFLHIGDDIRILNWWANIFVAVGLVFTFLGIVAALTKATMTMGQSADMTNMQAALTDLLRIAAAKFWTSIAGVLSSIILRIFDRRWRQTTRRDLEVICERLERGTMFSPPQRIAAEQLLETREQTVALKTFSHELAIAIGEQFETRMQPMVAVLGTIQSSINDFKEGSFAQIGKELGNALSATAGREMEGLSAALTQMTHGLSSIHERLSGSGDAANRQIEAAAGQFASASAEMARSFESLNERVGSMADRLAAQADEATTRTAERMAQAQAGYQDAAEENGKILRDIGVEMRSASAATTSAMVDAVRNAVSAATSEGTAATRAALDQFASASSGIQDAFSIMDTRIREMGATLSSTAETSAARNADVLDRAAKALEGAAARASADMGSSVTEAVQRAADESGRAMTASLARFGEEFERASAGLVQALQTTAGRMEAIAGAIERSTRASDDHTLKMTSAAASADGIASTLGRAANDVQAAAAPIRDATATISNTIVNTRELMRQQTESAEANRAQLEAVAVQFQQTAAAASEAWRDYQERFADVDRALASALDQIKNASSEHAGHLNSHVGKLDSALGEAVDRLSNALDPLQDMATSVEDMLGRLKTPA